jgi:hypothetical protein
MATTIPTGMKRQRGMFDTIEYVYKGVVIKRGTGRFHSCWEYYLDNRKYSSRLGASNLKEAARDIDKYLTLQN